MSGPPRALLDTDTLSYIRRGDPPVWRHAKTYLDYHARFTFSEITPYEILRGLLAAKASAQITAFTEFCEASEVVPVERQDLERAAQIWADLKLNGQLMSDADIIIAATAHRRGLAVVSHNLAHFSRIAGLQVVDWAAPPR